MVFRDSQEILRRFVKQWLEKFASFYLGEKRKSDLSESCALQSLTPEVIRYDDKTRQVFKDELIKAVEVSHDQAINIVQVSHGVL